MDNKLFLNKTKRLFEAYEAICKPYCQEMDISVQAFEILMFISKNKGITTAQEICKQQNIKPNLMSFHIDKLVQSGFIERQVIDGNRRSIKLVCTVKAKQIIEKGIKIYDTFSQLIWKDISSDERNMLKIIYEKIDSNAEKIIKDYNK